jgi:hypothetical protein
LRQDRQVVGTGAQRGLHLRGRWQSPSRAAGRPGFRRRRSRRSRAHRRPHNGGWCSSPLLCVTGSRPAQEVLLLAAISTSSRPCGSARAAEVDALQQRARPCEQRARDAGGLPATPCRTGSIGSGRRKPVTRWAAA